MFESGESRLDQNFLRPAGATKYLFASFFTGAGVMDEAMRRAGYTLASAAETDTLHHASYGMNFGVTPYRSNAAALAELRDDIVTWVFGFECTSMARPGRREGLAHSSWDAFDEIVTALKERQVLSFHCENVADLLESPAFERERHYVLDSFRDAGYVTIQGSVDPSDFGFACSRRRCHILGMRRDVAELVGWGDQAVATQPFDTMKAASPRCIADRMPTPRGEVEEADAIDFHAFAAAEKAEHGREWYIKWKQEYNTAVKRDSLRREDVVARNATLTLGYIRLQGKPLNRRTGFKVGSVFGLMHGISSTPHAEGPGKNGCFYYDPLTKKTQTLSLSTIRRIWDLPSFSLHRNTDVAKRQLGLTAHPAGTTANAILQALYLDKYFYLKGISPPVPRLEFPSKTSIWTALGQEEWARWCQYVVSFTLAVRSGRKKGSPRAFVGNSKHTTPWAVGRAWDLRPCRNGKPPVLLERRGRAKHELCLSELLSRDDDTDYPHDPPYDDPEIAAMTEWLGLSSGANPSMMTVAVANGSLWIEQEETGMAGLKQEAEWGWWEFSADIPFWPIRISPFFMVQQGPKWRRVHHLSKDPLKNGQSVNDQLSLFEKARLDLVRRDQITAALVDLCQKYHLMTEGWGWTDLQIVLGWVDLKNAYNQVNTDVRDLWFNCGSYVTPSEAPGGARLLIGAGSKAAFGGGDTVRAFSRITRLNNWAVNRSLERAGGQYELQQEYRAELERRKGRLPAGYRPLAALHAQTTGKKMTYHDRVAAALEAEAPSRYLDGWRGIDQAAGVTSRVIDRRPGPSCCEKNKQNLSSSCTYLDDCITGAIVPRGDCGERLRQTHVRQTIEKGGFVVVNDQKSEKKWQQGRMAPVQKVLGCVIDLSDPLKPTIGTTEEKQQRALALVEALLSHSSSHIAHKKIESMVGVLGDVAQVVLRGTMHLCGFYAVPLTAWLRRNAEWWRRYLASGAPRQRLLILPPLLPKKYCPHTDASTSFGFGGFWIKGDECFYIQGEWTAAEKALINDFEMGINFLEAATCGFLLVVARGNFEGKHFKFYCDNQCTVQILTSYKTRTLGLASQGELVDMCLSKDGLESDFVWLKSEDNPESDALSRGWDGLVEFKQLIVSQYGVSKFVYLQVPPEVRDLSRCLETFREHPHWCVADGVAEEAEATPQGM